LLKGFIVVINNVVNELEVVEVADKYRITITRPVREVVPLRIGQKVAVVPFGERIIVQPLPDNPEKNSRN